jgi:hypothetical protein
VARRLEHSPQLVDLCILLRRCVAGMPVLRDWGNGGVVVVVVLGVELELVGGCGSHCEGDCSVGISKRAMEKVQAIGVAEYVSSRCGVERGLL